MHWPGAYSRRRITVNHRQPELQRHPQQGPLRITRSPVGFPVVAESRLAYGNRPHEVPGQDSNSAGNRCAKQDGPAEPMISGGAFGIGVLGRLLTRVGCGSLIGIRGQFDRDRCWKCLGSESFESRLLLCGKSHLPGNPAVCIHRKRDAAMAHALLHELGMGAGSTWIAMNKRRRS